MLRVIYLTLGVLLTQTTLAHINPNNKPLASTPDTLITFRSNCDPPRAQIDLAVNNVRARLTTGGDLWWNGEQGRYIVPKVPPGVPEVSAIYAGGVWMGGVDDGGNLKLAAQTYGRSQGQFDFWPGPLVEGIDPTVAGTTDQATCANWDQLFSVKRNEVDQHLHQYFEAKHNNELYDPNTIPRSILSWPARGNPFFSLINGFELPPAQLGLAGFFDNDGDGSYNPLEGDYPLVDIRGCFITELPDELIFWIYNDNGNIHFETAGATMQMEVQAYAFAYASDDQVNDMTFQHYRLINRAIEPLDSTFFAIWVDPDLGCYADDYVGCDVERNMAYIYNEDALDGTVGCTCPQEVNTYCDEIPILGVDFLRGPIGPKIIGPNGELINPAVGEDADTIVELGMSSFTYYNSGFQGGPPGTLDPGNAQEYYNYLTGSWRDGSPFEFGGDGYQEPTYPVKYAFPDAPNNPEGWSMCTAGSGGGQIPSGGDRRTIQASGPFRLDPGAVNEITVGIVWVPDQSYPCPSIRALQAADDRIQTIFNECFVDCGTPDAPDIDFIELDREIILLLSNDSLIYRSNNANEEYMESRGCGLPNNISDPLYRFEGYQIYQLAGPDIAFSKDNKEDPTKVRLIHQVDLKNEVGKIFNWEVLEKDKNPGSIRYYTPILKVDGANEGIRHSFRITEDAFAEGDRRLVNHKKYYFAAIAYAHNEFEPFDPDLITGQPKPYIRSRRNIGANFSGLPYTAIPRPITDRKLNAQYGDGAKVTRLDGLGSGSNFLDITEETRQAMEAAFAAGEAYEGNITYQNGAGPIHVNIFNPLDVMDGRYELRFVDSNQSDNQLDSNARWVLTSLDDPDLLIASEKTIERLNEQIIKELGFAVSIGQTPEPGSTIDASNGFIGYEVEVEGNAAPWLGFIPDDFDPSLSPLDDHIFDFLSTAPGERDAGIDPQEGLSEFGNFAFMPYYLLDYRSRGEFDRAFLGPVYTEPTPGSLLRSDTDLGLLNNVDIVFTADKALWSRCVIVESANEFYEDLPGYDTDPYIFNGQESPARMFDLRPAPSVGKEADRETGLPLPDGSSGQVEGEVFDLYGYGWFPGYAIDVETGERLNIFFGENSIYNGDTLSPFYREAATGGDMMFNPTSEIVLQGVNYENQPLPFVYGGQHYVYVTRQAYDGCQSLLKHFYRPEENWSVLRKVHGIRQITWAGAIVMQPNTEMLSYEEGLIPAKTTVKLRVTNAYEVEKDKEEQEGDERTGNGENNYHPLYQFTIEGQQAEALDGAGVSNALDKINIVPNPYYGFSSYETSQLTNTVKVTNLPAKCTISIYTLEGNFIRQYLRDEVGAIPWGTNRAINRRQITPDLEWDLKNHKNLPVASGVYLIHIAAPGLGERTLKWFGINRPFDPAGF